jgi:hypothetical protein
MGKNIIYTFSCDKCKKIFKDPKDVMRLKGSIMDGEDETIYIEKTDGECFCKECFINRIFKTESKRLVCENNIQITDTIPEEVPTAEYATLLKIVTEKDELTFIQFLGHVSKENFNKLCNKSLIGAYYPVEECVEIDLLSCYNSPIQLVYKMFAGIPQIKTVDAYVDDNNNVAFILKSQLEE